MGAVVIRSFGSGGLSMLVRPFRFSLWGISASWVLVSVFFWLLSPVWSCIAGPSWIKKMNNPAAPVVIWFLNIVFWLGGAYVFVRFLVAHVLPFFRRLGRRIFGGVSDSSPRQPLEKVEMSKTFLICCAVAFVIFELVVRAFVHAGSDVGLEPINGSLPPPSAGKLNISPALRDELKRSGN